ncbi:HERV-H LTR-associating protein 2 isoform X1 [Ictalurus punctatus]|uniref:HERV-H LTR-associating protein 2 isoform X1 n=1 Tax=Ictalurus punctatus TaxID=7998 RepID=A0A979E292_ICTPU|nr:HERV-H LTR-associating protein 2 isoform X1 [Ictalurus punctatus]
MKPVILTFVLFWSIPLTTEEDVTVYCIVTSNCVLPCTSTYHDIIHWYKEGKADSVHTFYNKADDLQYQDVDFKGRTSLFKDQIPQGNASLLLSSFRTEDQGKYKCYTATNSENREQFVLLKIKVPVKWVDLKMTSEGITCSTKDVYPEPNISWFRDGRSEDKFTVNRTGDKEGLFSVSSVLTQSVAENTTYSCSISLRDESQHYTASLRKENVEIYPGHNVTIHCPVSQDNTGNSNITLTYGESSTTLTYTQTSQLPTTTVQWRGKTLHLARDGTVTIHNPENVEYTGTYTCERLTAQSRHVVHTEVKICSANTIRIALGVTVAIVVVTIAAVCLIMWKRANNMRNRGESDVNPHNGEGNGVI